MQTTCTQQNLSAADRDFLLRLARRALTRLLVEGLSLEVDPAGLAPGLLEERATFVTLTSGGELRGCVGQVMFHSPLYRSVMDNACGAALRDPRFAPVKRGELADLRIEISVLSALLPLSFTSPEDLLSKLQPHLHGVVLRIGGQLSTFLPQVWAQIHDKEDFMKRLSQKAGHASSAWREEEATVWTYSVEHFEEP